MKPQRLVLLIAFLILGGVYLHINLDPEFFKSDPKMNAEYIDSVELNLHMSNSKSDLLEMQIEYFDLRRDILNEMRNVPDSIDIGKIRYDEDGYALIGYGHYIEEGESFTSYLEKDQCDSILNVDFEKAVSTIHAQYPLSYKYVYPSAKYIIAGGKLNLPVSPEFQKAHRKKYVKWLKKLRRKRMDRL